jgi:hypothetical protein
LSAATPLARSKTAALARVLDAIPKGYAHYTAGVCKAAKAEALARKFHQRYGIGATPAQRITRKRKGEANALLVLFWPPEAAEVHWLLLATPGSGPVREQEALRAVSDPTHLFWLGYELVRHASRGQTAWTWRRTKAEMSELYALLAEQLNRRHAAAVADTLARVARQPGFAGVREQSWALCEFARSRGHAGELPHLFFVQKVGHGDRLAL